MEYCRDIGCYQEAVTEEGYCYEHVEICWEHEFPQRCSKRVPAYDRYCHYHDEHYKSLVRQKTGLTNIQKVTRIQTWWNNNLATVINGDGPYSVWLIVYEPSQNGGKIKEILEKFEVSENVLRNAYQKHTPMYDYNKYDLDDVKSAVFLIRLGLEENNPILLIHPKVDEYVSFDNLITSPYVRSYDLPVEVKWESVKECTCYPGCPCYHCDCYKSKLETVYPNNADDYVKPLDIVMVGRSILGNDFRHVGIYLGNNLVCHVSDVSSKKIDTRDNNHAIITSWKTFVDVPKREILCVFHPVIPFKNYRKMAQQIAWAKDNNYSWGTYCVANKNCEHFANMIVYGINYSEQVESNPSKSSEYARYQGVNNGKSSINLRSEISQTDGRFGSYGTVLTSQIQARVVIPPKQNCLVM